MENIISVVVITYNEEKTIARTLDSILEQKCHVPFEIVVGDDCSTDGTRKICEEYAEKYPNIIRLMDKAPNKGVIDNYYDCVLNCKGKYIADCAGDDFWITSDKLEKEVSILEKDESITLVHTEWMYYNEKTGERTPPAPNVFNKPITEGKVMLEAIVTQTSRPIIHSCTAMYRADVLKREYNKNTYLFRNKEFGCEDLQVCFIMALNGNIAYIPDVTLCYSYGTPTVSFSNNDKKQFLFVRRITDLSYYLCTEYGLKSKTIDKYFQQRIFALSMHAFRSGSRQLRLETKKCKEKWGIEGTWKTALVNAISSNCVSWKLALYLRKLFVAIKKL
ncbi:MAG: glycosyltransferase [Prevotella sp.]|nr:glycosyltransferase [Prevotella sp.]